VTALARIDARHLLRSPLLWLGVPFAVLFLLAIDGLLHGWPVLPQTALTVYEYGLFASAGVVLAGAWLGLRDVRHATAPIVHATPTPPWTLWRSRLLAAALAGAALPVLLTAAALVVSAARGGRGVPDPRLLVDGALAWAMAAWLGLAVGALTRSRMASVLAFSGWVVIPYLSGNLLTGITRVFPILVAEQHSVVLGFLPDPFWPHLLYLSGLLALLGGAVLVGTARAEGFRRAPRLAVLPAAGLAATLVGGGLLLGVPRALAVESPDPATWRPVADWQQGRLDSPGVGAPVPWPQDGRATACAEGAVTVCVYPAFGRGAARAAGTALEPVAELFAGLPGVPTRVRMVTRTGSPCDGAEVQVAEGYEGVDPLLLRETFVTCVLDPDITLPGVPVHPEAPAAAAVADWALKRVDPGYRTSLELQEEFGVLEEAGPLAAELRSQDAATDALLALPDQEVRAGLAPLWDRLRAGEVGLDELPGAAR
jgi:hypothetical protein